MTFSTAFFLVLLLAAASCAMAADGPASTQPSTGPENQPFAETLLQPVPSDLTRPFTRFKIDSDGFELRSSQLWNHSLSELNGDICYTMRSYKVKPTERFTEGKNAQRGYSTCEMASGYRFRSAEAKPRDASAK